MNKYLECVCDKLGGNEISPLGLKHRIDAFEKYQRHFAVLATIESPVQLALLQCRDCGKMYQESPCGRGMIALRYIYEIEAIEEEVWMHEPFPDPYSSVLETEEARALGLR